MKNSDLNSMSIEKLWALHEEIASILLTKMEAEKLKLEKRLDQLGCKVLDDGQRRRPYPDVHLKFRNPNPPHQTWSGRGKQPELMGKAIVDS
jgi:DNA-binding protein H-NS